MPPINVLVDFSKVLSEITKKIETRSISDPFYLEYLRLIRIAHINPEGLESAIKAVREKLLVSY